MYVVPFCIKLSLYMYVFIGLFICSLIYLSIFIYLLILSIQSIYKPLIFLVINSIIHIYLVRHQPICFYPSFYQSIHPFSIHLSMNTCTCMYIYIIIYIYIYIYLFIYIYMYPFTESQLSITLMSDGTLCHQKRKGTLQQLYSFNLTTF